MIEPHTGLTNYKLAVVELYIQGITSLVIVQVSQVETLPAGYTVNITHGEVLHIGESLTSGLSLSEGDTQDTSPFITISDSSVCCCKDRIYRLCQLFDVNMLTHTIIEYCIQLWSKHLELP